MAAAYALISILSATAGTLVLWPSFGWWSLASIWPVGGISCLLAAILVAEFRDRRGHDLDHLADGMVADLRGVLADSRQVSGDDDQADSDARRSGTSG